MKSVGNGWFSGPEPTARVVRPVSPAADTLRRTPLYDRHAAAGAKLVPFAGWEMPVQYEGIRQEHVAVRTGAGLFDVSHMGEIRTTGADAERFLQRILSNDVTKIARERRPVLAALQGGRRRPRRPVHVPLRRGRRRLPDRHERVEPRQGPGLVPEAGGRLRRRRHRHRRARRLRDARPPGARTRAAILREHLDGEEPKRMRWTLATVAGVHDVGVARHRLHGRGRRRAADPARRRRRRSGTRWSARASPRPAWARATRCASRSASTCTATTCPRTATRSRPA